MAELQPILSDNLDGILYHKVRTDDGWDLTITHLRPKRLNPEIRYPLLAVHGFCQNRKAYKSGKFTTHLIDGGVDVYLLELRGHGKSAVEHQHDGAYDWCFDHYVAHDLPSALNQVKNISGKDQVYLCGHSLGGMLGYAALPLYEDIRGLVAMGAPAQMDKEHRILRMVSNLEWLVDPPLFGEKLRERFDKVPISGALDLVRMFYPIVKHASFFPDLWKQENVNEDELKILFGEGGADESTRIVAQILRWVNREEFRSYTDLNTMGFDVDYRAGFANIDAPILLVRGEEDRLATPENTRPLIDTVRPDLLEEVIVRSTNHLGLTMGLSTETLCPRIIRFLKERST